MSDVSRQIIEFHGRENSPFPAPYPASRSVPDWLKNMPQMVLDRGSPDGAAFTVKKCAPFLEAMTCGYVIPLMAGVQFFMRDTQNLEFVQESAVVEAQNPRQYAEAPFGRRIIVKFNNPWIVKTAPGYSTLFCPLLNQFNIPFQTLSGIVETDSFYQEVNLPAICVMNPGEHFTMQAGTPLMQVIPFRRQDWQSEIRERDSIHAADEAAAILDNRHLYKDSRWVKKEYR